MLHFFRQQRGGLRLVEKKGGALRCGNCKVKNRLSTKLKCVEYLGVVVVGGGGVSNMYY